MKKKAILAFFAVLVLIFATACGNNEKTEQNSVKNTSTFEGISVEVINMHTIKPLDKEAVLKAVMDTRRIITVEDHTVIGGLGSAVSEVVCENCPVPVLRVGVEDKFGKSGKVPALLEAYGLTTENIVAKAKAAIAAKKN